MADITIVHSETFGVTGPSLTHTQTPSAGIAAGRVAMSLYYPQRAAVGGSGTTTRPTGFTNIGEGSVCILGCGARAAYKVLTGAETSWTWTVTQATTLHVSALLILDTNGYTVGTNHGNTTNVFDRDSDSVPAGTLVMGSHNTGGSGTKMIETFAYHLCGENGGPGSATSVPWYEPSGTPLAFNPDGGGLSGPLNAVWNWGWWGNATTIEQTAGAENAANVPFSGNVAFPNARDECMYRQVMKFVAPVAVQQDHWAWAEGSDAMDSWGAQS